MGILSKITHPKNYYAKYTMSIGDGNFCYIDQEFTGELTPEKEKILYTESMILFLKRYFFIADKRQVQPMREILAAHIEQPEASFMDVMSWTEKMIFDNLNESERKNLASYASHRGVLPAFLSPEPITNKAGKYEIYIVNAGQEFDIKFFMKLTGDKVILSRLPILFLQFIESKLDKKSIETLHNRISVEYLS